MVCVICQAPGSLICSWECVQTATRELDVNVEELRRLPRGDGGRYELAVRNGELTSALLTWKPALTE